MTRPFDPQRLQFYLTIPSPCPYLPGRMERKIFTQLDPFGGSHLNNYLTHAGFRRSQNVIYRPACENCQECRSVRIIAPQFEAGRNMRRIIKRNADLKRTVNEPLATQEQFNLLQEYLHARHLGGGMSDMDFIRYELMVEECASQTEILEYRKADNTLVACIIIDQLSDGLSLVYSFFTPEDKSRGLGNYMILDQITRCNELGHKYAYLGYWVPGSPKMDYKSRFKPFEILTSNGWRSQVSQTGLHPK